MNLENNNIMKFTVDYEKGIANLQLYIAVMSVTALSQVILDILFDCINIIHDIPIYMP